jgi:2,4-diketo-3-deoxy-L-fuconate hydrolase
MGRPFKKVAPLFIDPTFQKKHFMRIIRFGSVGAEKPGLLDSNGQRRDLSGIISDWSRETLASGALVKVLALNVADLPTVAPEERWAAPVARPGKLIGIGLNYADHAKEAGAPIPEEPIIFLKGTNTVVGPYDHVLIPRGSTKTDWEVELGVIIGSTARYCANEADAEACILGYAISNDVSERCFQLEHGGQWTKGKSCDTFNPLGPWILTRDELSDPQNLSMELDVNGHPRQRGNTRTMVFTARHIVYYLSQFMTLEPGDVITTGTPPGVGLGMKPPTYLEVGDVVDLRIEHLGAQKQRFISA